jgi:hypothetical protein
MRNSFLPLRITLQKKKKFTWMIGLKCEALVSDYKLDDFAQLEIERVDARAVGGVFCT